MLHRCRGGGAGGAVAPCTCGVLHGACSGGASATPFSILFPMSSGKQQPIDDHYRTSPTSNAVDCTLSLGTPSTRRNEKGAGKQRPAAPAQPSCVPSFCWDIISQQGKHGGSAARSAGGDPLLLARRCANCDTTSTPLWRNGPRGPKSLCNACGIRYKKEERRAAATPSSSSSSERVAAGYGFSSQPAWSGYSSASISPAISMSFTGDQRVGMASWGHEDDDDINNGEVPYLSWRLNVAPSPRTSLFQYQ